MVIVLLDEAPTLEETQSREVQRLKKENEELKEQLHLKDILLESLKERLPSDHLGAPRRELKKKKKFSELGKSCCLF